MVDTQRLVYSLTFCVSQFPEYICTVCCQERRGSSNEPNEPNLESADYGAMHTTRMISKRVAHSHHRGEIEERGSKNEHSDLLIRPVKRPDKSSLTQHNLRNACASDFLVEIISIGSAVSDSRTH
jgi:hypothetical protein